MRTRRGTTLLETVLAVAILGVIAVAITSAITFANGSEVRRQQRLAANEVAHRMMLMYVDNPYQFKRDFPLDRPYFDGRYNWRYDYLESEPIPMESNIPMFDENAFEAWFIRVRVYRGVAVGGGNFAPGEKMAEMVRIYSPFVATSRNPDSTGRTVKEGEWLRTMLEQARRSGTRGGTGAPGRGSGGPGAGAGSGSKR